MASYVQTALINNESVFYQGKVSLWSLTPYFVIGLFTLPLFGLGLLFWLVIHHSSCPVLIYRSSCHRARGHYLGFHFRNLSQPPTLKRAVIWHLGALVAGSDYSSHGAFPLYFYRAGSGICHFRGTHGFPVDIYLEVHAGNQGQVVGRTGKYFNQGIVKEA